MHPSFSALYRVACFIGFGCTAYWAIENLGVGKSFKEKLYDQVKFLTFDTLLLQIVYYFLAFVLIPVNLPRVKSMLSCLALTSATLVSVLFWGLYFYDLGLLGDLQKHSRLPFWFMHVTHTLVSVAAFVDVLFAKLSSLPHLKTLATLILMYAGYIVHTEWLIYSQNVYVYPLLKSLELSGRSLFYAAMVFALLSIFLFSSLLIKYFGFEKKRKSKKAKKESPTKQQASQNSSTSKNIPRKTKQRKQD